MANFLFKVRTTEGKLREGKLEAQSLDRAVTALQKENLIIISVTPESESGTAFAHFQSLFDRITHKDMVILSRQLSTLFEAKVPVVQSLRTLGGESAKPKIRNILAHVLDDIQGGMSMSQAMERQPELFSVFYVNMVRSGEESGKLGEVFTYLADYLERSYELRSKTKSALIYPAFVVFAFGAVMFLVLTVIIPNLKVIFDEAGVSLPWYTSVVINLGVFLQQFWIILFLALGVGGVAFWRYLQTPIGRKSWAHFILALPMVGPLLQKIYMARLADNLETLLSAGVPVIRSMQVTASVIGSDVYRDILLDAIDSVKGGSTISDALEKYSEIPPLATQMMRIGEESGKMATMLNSLSRFYRREVDTMVDGFVSLIEPILILVLGFAVAFLVAAVLLPLYSLSAAF